MYYLIDFVINDYNFIIFYLTALFFKSFKKSLFIVK
jgi:hypothetical protein